MKDWLKLKLPEAEAEVGIPEIGQSVVLYCCPSNWKGDLEKVWRSDIGSLHMAEDAIPVWNSAIGSDSPFDGVKVEDILKDYELCFAEVPTLNAEQFSEGWLKAELPEEIPLTGQSVVLRLCPRDRNQAKENDIGSLYVEDEDETPFWGSAFGIQSGFDGIKFEDILKDYEVIFTEVPPLEAGRFPPPLGIAVEGWNCQPASS